MNHGCSVRRYGRPCFVTDDGQHCPARLAPVAVPFDGRTQQLSVTDNVSEAKRERQPVQQTVY